MYVLNHNSKIRLKLFTFLIFIVSDCLAFTNRVITNYKKVYSVKKE